MNIEPTKAYVYQPMAPKPDGRFYGVGGLHLFGLDFDEADLRGITRDDAEKIAKVCNDNPEKVAITISAIKYRMANDWQPECGCRFESLFSNTILLCEECSKLPSHSGGV